MDFTFKFTVNIYSIFISFFNHVSKILRIIKMLKIYLTSLSFFILKICFFDHSFFREIVRLRPFTTEPSCCPVFLLRYCILLMVIFYKHYPQGFAVNIQYFVFLYLSLYFLIALIFFFLLLPQS